MNFLKMSRTVLEEAQKDIGDINRPGSGKNQSVYSR